MNEDSPMRRMDAWVCDGEWLISYDEYDDPLYPKWMIDDVERLEDKAKQAWRELWQAIEVCRQWEEENAKAEGSSEEG